MHGLGNDYVYVSLFSETVTDAPTLARVMSDRHTGIGSDGLILIGPSESADVRMEMFNADGSRAQMCGNGIRCVAKYAVEHGLAVGPELRIQTDDGIKSAKCHAKSGRVGRVRIDMGEPALEAKAIPCTINLEQVVDCPLRVGNRELRVTCVSMGNPHAVVFVDDPGEIDLAIVGPALERAPEFPERINAHFVRVTSPDHVVVRTWERGSGITRACGTGACAVCVAGAVTGRTQRSMTVSLPGGDLEIEWAPNNRVYMTGPAVEVYTGEWPDA